jgi:hypothetical protein
MVAGTPLSHAAIGPMRPWVPAFAGMTGVGGIVPFTLVIPAQAGIQTRGFLDNPQRQRI